MQKIEYPLISLNFNFQKTSLESIYAYLYAAKEEYILTNGCNFVQVYLILKDMFCYYVYYIDFSIKHANDIDEGNNLPGSIDRMKLWLKKINTCLPINLNRQLTDFMGPFIGLPDGFDQVTQTFHKISKFNSYRIIKYNEVNEPYVRKENSSSILFGFVNMEGARTGQNPDGSTQLKLECPRKCTVNLKRWICTKCGNFVSNKDMTLFCSCGSKRYKEELLICHHPSHRLQEFIKKQNSNKDVNHIVRNRRETHQQVFNSDSSLSDS